MKIAILSGKLYGGGAERVATVLANYWSENGIDVHLFRGDGCETDCYHINQNVTLIDLDFDYQKNKGSFLIRAFEYLRRLVILRKKIKSLSPDFLIGVKEDSAIRASISLIFTKVKVIACEHNNYYAMRSRLKRLIRNAIYFFIPKKITVLTQDDFENYPFFIRHKIVVMENPLGINGLLHSSEKKKESINGFKFLAVGRLTEQKGYFRLLDIFNKVSNNDWILNIAGDGELKYKILNKINELGLGDRVNLLGSVSNMEDLYLSHDALVMSSYWEGLPMVIGEALSFSLPVIAYDCPTGPKVFIKNNANGFLIPNGNEDLFVEALNTVIKNRQLYDEMKIRASESISQYTIEIIGDKWRSEVFNKL